MWLASGKDIKWFPSFEQINTKREDFKCRWFSKFPFRNQPLRCSGRSGAADGVKCMSTAPSERKPLGDSQNSTDSYKYFGSEAEKIRAFPVNSVDDERKSYIVMASLAAFLIYFCILREPNELDEMLDRDIYDHFGPEASRLKKAYEYNIKHNLPTGEITNRLRQLGAPLPPGV